MRLAHLLLLLERLAAASALVRWPLLERSHRANGASRRLTRFGQLVLGRAGIFYRRGNVCFLLREAVLR